MFQKGDSFGEKRRRAAAYRGMRELIASRLCTARRGKKRASVRKGTWTKKRNNCGIRPSAREKWAERKRDMLTKRARDRLKRNPEKRAPPPFPAHKKERRRLSSRQDGKSCVRGRRLYLRRDASPRGEGRRGGGMRSL